MSEKKEISVSGTAEEKPAGYYPDVRFYKPPADIYETENEFGIYLDMPGVKKGDLVVKLEDNIHLLVEGKINKENKTEGQYVKNECYYTGYQRYFHLSDDVNKDKIEAEYKDGVLKVKLPKKEEVKPREISIK